VKHILHTEFVRHLTFYRHTDFCADILLLCSGDENEIYSWQPLTADFNFQLRFQHVVSLEDALFHHGAKLQPNWFHWGPKYGPPKNSKYIPWWLNSTPGAVHYLKFSKKAYLDHSAHWRSHYLHVYKIRWNSTGLKLVLVTCKILQCWLMFDWITLGVFVWGSLMRRHLWGGVTQGAFGRGFTLGNCSRIYRGGECVVESCDNISWSVSEIWPQDKIRKDTPSGWI